jgi:two-component system, OmpR family, sensor histidine kinase KdpD
MSLGVSSIFLPPRAKPFEGLGRAGLLVRSGIAFAVVPAVTWLAFEVHLNLTATSLLQLLAVLAIALRVGFWPAALASLFANLSLNYFFVPPLFSLYIADPQNWIAVGVFELSALIVSRLSTQARQEAARAVKHEKEVQRLYEFSLELLLLTSQGTDGREIVSLIERIFNAEAVVLVDAFDERVYTTGRGNLEDLEMAAQAASVDGSEQSSPDGFMLIRVLSAGIERLGVIGLRGTTFTPGTANTLASLISIAMDHARSIEREGHAEAERKAEQLRTTVLDALAHEYKTPLTALRAAASGLLEIGRLDPIQMDLVSLIDSEVGRLNSLTTRLLQMSRLDSAKVRLRPEVVDPNELISKVLASMPEVLAGHELHIENLASEAFVKVDLELVSMALSQLLDNAAKHSDPASPITVSVSATPIEVCLSVHNYGPFIPPDERGLIFQRFYRGLLSKSKGAGTGIGLSISRKVAAAHHGRVWVTSGKERGNTFSLALPRHGRESR